MNIPQVRPAALDDTTAISGLFRSHITVWQRVGAGGAVEDVPYEHLTIYERWLHGGAWMSVETGAIQLSHLLRGAGVALVAERDGELLAYAEAYHGVEPAPYGDHLHLATLIQRHDSSDSAVADALLARLLSLAKTYQCARLTANRIGIDPAAEKLYRKHSLTPVGRINRLNLPARSGQGFYKTVDHLNANPAQISEWHMPVGRMGSARQQWETLWPRTFNALPEITERRTHRLHFSAAGQEAFVCCQETLYTPRSADVYLWSPKPLTSQLLTALRDWSHREGYRTLVMAVSDETAKVLGPEAEADGYYVDVYGADV